MSQIYCWHKVGSDTAEEIYIPAMQPLDSENSCSTTIRTTSKNRKIVFNCFNGFFIITFILAVIFTVILSYFLYSITRDTEDAYDSGGNLKVRFPNLLFVSDRNKLLVYDPSVKRSIPLLEENSDINAFDIYKNELLFYATTDATTFHSSSRTHRNVSHIKKWKPHAVAVDYLTNKLYVIDKLAGTLNVVDVDNERYHNVLLSDLSRPHDLALDPDRALMFIVQYSQSIIRASMDGSMLKVIIKKSHCSAITLDRREQKIYWGNDFHSIEVSNYEGQSRKELVKASINVQSLAFVDDKLYWTWPEYWMNNATLWSCDIGANGNCHNQILHSTTDLVKPNQIKANVVDFDHKTSKPVACNVNNAGCQQLCLLSANSSTGYRCACSLGWQLNPDGRTCIHVTEFILYVQDDFVRGRVLDDETSSLSDVIYPVQLHYEPLKHKKTLHFDSDQRKDYVYFSDDRSIYRKTIIQDSSQVRLFNASGDKVIKDVAFDWLSNNLYFTLSAARSHEEHEIVVMSLNKPFLLRTVKRLGYSNYPLDGCPYSLVVCPSHGYVFFTRRDAEPSVKRLDLDGVNKQLIYNLQESSEFRQVSVDPHEEMLYMLNQSYDETVDSLFNRAFYGVTVSESRNPKNNTKQQKRRIELSVTTYDGSAVRQLELLDAVAHPSCLVPYKDSVFLCSLEVIVRYDKVSGAKRTRVLPANDELEHASRTIHGMVIFSPHLQYPSERRNPCALGNGGCEQFCFAGLDKSCACEDGKHSVGGDCVAAAR